MRSEQFTFHEPAPAPLPWMRAGVRGSIAAVGTQVRAGQTDDGIEVGSFPALDPQEVASMVANLEGWRRQRLQWRTIGPELPADMLVVGVYRPDDGEDHGEGGHGPGFLFPDGHTLREDLVDAALLYLRHQTPRD